MQKKMEPLEILEDVHNSLTETLKQVVNEPSVGLYFVQQHVHKAVPSLLALNAQLEETAGDAELATADAKDGLSSLRTMKECGPPVIEHMIKTLKSASNTIPVRKTRGSVSQLLPRPIRPPGVGRGPLRSSSFVGDWRSERSKNKGQAPCGDIPKDPVLGTLNNHQISPVPNEPGHTVQEPSFVLDAKKNDLAVERSSNPNQGDMPISVGNDSSQEASDAYQKSAMPNSGDSSWPGNTGTKSLNSNHEIKEADVAMDKNPSSGTMMDESGGNPSHYMRAVLDSAFLTAGSVSREGAKLLRIVGENESGDGRLKSILGFNRKTQKILEEDEGEAQHVGGGKSGENLRQAEDNFEKFKAEHAAKLEMWLSESDGDSSSVS